MDSGNTSRHILKIVLISNDRFTTYSSNKIIKFFDLNVWNVLEDLCGHEDKVWCIDKLNNYRIVSC